MSTTAYSYQNFDNRQETEPSGEVNTERDWIGEFQKLIASDSLNALRDRPEGRPDYSSMYDRYDSIADRGQLARAEAIGGSALNNANREQQHEQREGFQFQHEEDDARREAEHQRSQEQAEVAKKALTIGAAIVYMRKNKLDSHL